MKPTDPVADAASTREPAFLALPAIVRIVLRGLSFVVIPGLLAALVLRWLVPRPGSTDGPLRWIASAGHQYPVVLGAALFLLFAALVRYWYPELPGGRYLTSIPLEIAAGIDRKELRSYARAAERAVQGRRQAWWFAASVLLAGGAAVFLRVAIVESYQVLSASMLPTLEAGDRVLANKLAYGFRFRPWAWGERILAPRRGDVVVFRNRTHEGPEHLVKRVIGLPGDRITMRGDHPIINGWEVPSCDAGTYVYPFVGGVLRGRLRVEFLDERAYLTLQFGEKQPLREPHVVKPGEVFVVGDDRGNSIDSRTWNGGRGAGVAFADLAGRAQWFLASTHRDGRADFGRLFRPIERQVHFDGIDTGPIEQGIERCVTSEWPKQTKPPVEAPAPTTADGSSVLTEGQP